LLFPILTFRKPRKSAHLRCCAQMPVSGRVSRQNPASLSGARHARRVSLVEESSVTPFGRKEKRNVRNSVSRITKKSHLRYASRIRF
jgi:hypothetical protein